MHRGIQLGSHLTAGADPFRNKGAQILRYRRFPAGCSAGWDEERQAIHEIPTIFRGARGFGLSDEEILAGC